MNRLQIREFDPKDEAKVIALWVRCDLIVPQNDPVEDIAMKQSAEGGWFLVGVVDDTIIASCMVGYDGHRGCLNYLAVDPDFQRRGYGESVIAEAETLLRGVGCPKVNLLVRSTNTQVLSFYQTLGYSDNECLSLGKRLIPDRPN